MNYLGALVVDHYRSGVRLSHEGATNNRCRFTVGGNGHDASRRSSCCKGVDKSLLRKVLMVAVRQPRDGSADQQAEQAQGSEAKLGTPVSFARFIHVFLLSRPIDNATRLHYAASRSNVTDEYCNNCNNFVNPMTALAESLPQLSSDWLRCIANLGPGGGCRNAHRMTTPGSDTPTSLHALD